MGDQTGQIIGGAAQGIGQGIQQGVQLGILMQQLQQQQRDREDRKLERAEDRGLAREQFGLSLIEKAKGRQAETAIADKRLAQNQSQFEATERQARLERIQKSLERQTDRAFADKARKDDLALNQKRLGLDEERVGLERTRVGLEKDRVEEARLEAKRLLDDQARREQENLTQGLENRLEDRAGGLASTYATVMARLDDTDQSFDNLAVSQLFAEAIRGGQDARELTSKMSLQLAEAASAAQGAPVDPKTLEPFIQRYVDFANKIVAATGSDVSELIQESPRLVSLLNFRLNEVVSQAQQIASGGEGGRTPESLRKALAYMDQQTANLFQEEANVRGASGRLTDLLNSRKASRQAEIDAKAEARSKVFGDKPLSEVETSALGGKDEFFRASVEQGGVPRDKLRDAMTRAARSGGGELEALGILNRGRIAHFGYDGQKILRLPSSKEVKPKLTGRATKLSGEAERTLRSLIDSMAEPGGAIVIQRVFQEAVATGAVPSDAPLNRQSLADAIADHVSRRFGER